MKWRPSAVGDDSPQVPSAPLLSNYRFKFFHFSFPLCVVALTLFTAGGGDQGMSGLFGCGAPASDGPEPEHMHAAFINKWKTVF